MNSKFFHQISSTLNLILILGMLFTQCQSYQKDPKGIFIKSYQEVPTIESMVQEAYDKNLPFLANTLQQLKNYEANNCEGNKAIDINQSDVNSYNETALHQAIRNLDGAKSLEAVKQLLFSGADVNAKAANNVTPLHLAIQKENVEMVKLLLDKGGNLEDATTNLQRRPIHIAAELSDPAIMQLLVNKGIAKGAGASININAPAYRGAIALHIAANFGNLKTVILLHEKGADINKQDQDELTPLHLAAHKGKTNVIEYLMKSGANSRTRVPNFIASPLHLAIYEGHVAAVEKLLEGDSDPKTYIELEAEYKSRPLHIAAYQGHVNIIKLLSEKGANKDAQDQNGFTALHWAALKGHPKAVQVLLEQGANKNIRNHRKHTPLQIAKFAPNSFKVTDKAKRKEYKEIVQLLKDAK